MECRLNMPRKIHWRGCLQAVKFGTPLPLLRSCAYRSSLIINCCLMRHLEHPFISNVGNTTFISMYEALPDTMIYPTIFFGVQGIISVRYPFFVSRATPVFTIGDPIICTLFPCSISFKKPVEYRKLAAIAPKKQEFTRAF